MLVDLFSHFLVPDPSQALIHEPIPREHVFQGDRMENEGQACSNDALSTKEVQESVNQSKRTRVALVFGREDLGLSDEEVESCDMACCIPIGRLQESLSLGHAVSIVLSGLFSQRLSFVSSSQGSDSSSSSYLVNSPAGLADGYDRDAGIEQ